MEVIIYGVTSCDGWGGGGVGAPYCLLKSLKRRVRAAHGRVALPGPSNIIQEKTWASRRSVALGRAGGRRERGRGAKRGGG